MWHLHTIKQAVRNAYGRFDKFTYIHGIRSLERLILPDFLGIGPPKTGTTWLCENLRCHPDVYISKEKEVHYFNHHFHQSLHFYSKKFEAGAGKIKGEITPEYYRLPLEQITFIQKIMPKVKLILLLRNPVDRAWSHAVMNVTLRGKTIEEVDDADWHKEFKNQPLFKMGGYMGVIKNWWSVFPREQLYVGLYDKIKNQPTQILQEVFDFIGVSGNMDWSSFPYNEVIIPPVNIQYKHRDKTRGVHVKGYINSTYSMPMKYRDFLREMYRPDVESLQNNLGLEISQWLSF